MLWIMSVAGIVINWATACFTIPGARAQSAYDSGSPSSAANELTTEPGETSPRRTRDAPTSQPAAAERLSASELSHRERAFVRRFLHRLPGLRRERPAGRDQGIPAEPARAEEGGRCPAVHLGREPGDLPLRHEVLLRGRALARAAVAPERGARAELLPRERDRLHGDALRARSHAAGAHPGAARLDQGELHPARVRAAAERAARGALQQAAPS